ncbi:MAG TPA: DUF1697 domain-containing protein [Chloroflexota bacterium]
MGSTCVALLRGINVGGKNKLPMKDLADLFAAAGCGDVRTYIQSGNVIFGTHPDPLEALPAQIAGAIRERWGFDVPVMLRTVEEMREVVRNNPFLQAGADEKALHVLFLDSPPDQRRIAQLDPDRSRPDEFAVRGREIYLWLPNGVARSRLTNDYFDSKLATTSTGRNWRSVLKLFDLMAS